MHSSSPIVISSSSSIGPHMPATVTQGPTEPQILYEHCVRPSGLRSGQLQQQQLMPCCQKDMTRRATEDKSMQTVTTPDPSAADLTNAEAEGQQWNEDVHTDLSDATTPRQTSQPSTEVLTTRSESRDSLNTWPPATTSAAYLPTSGGVRRRRMLLPLPRRSAPSDVTPSSAELAPVQPSGRTAVTNTAHRMPQLDWATTSRSFPVNRSLVPRRRSLRRLSNFIFYAILVVVLSIMLQWNFILHYCPTDRYNSRGVYATGPYSLYH